MDSLPPVAAMREVYLEFRAGKMIMEGKRVAADPRKGLFRIAKGEEGLLHFLWLDRTTNAVEDDQIIFPEEAIFEKVTQAPGRIYLLKFTTDDRKFFFWMQEPKSDNDSQLCDSVNFYINRPLELDEEEPDASVPLESSEDINEEDISSRAGDLVGSRVVADVSSNATSSGPVKLADLQRILSNIGAGGEVEDPDAGFGLGDLFKPDLLFPFLGTLPLEERLASFLPEGQWNPDDLIDLIQSPPFRQQVDSFTYVLRTGQIDLTQFGIDPSKYNFTVLSFLEALEDSVSKLDELTQGQASRASNDPMDESR